MKSHKPQLDDQISIVESHYYITRYLAAAEADLGQIFVLRRGLDKVRANLHIGNCLTAQFPVLLIVRNARERPPPFPRSTLQRFTYIRLLKPRVYGSSLVI